MLVRLIVAWMVAFVPLSGQSVFTPTQPAGVVGGAIGAVPPQQANASGKRYKITGTVVNAITGEPVGKALVTGPNVRTFTDASGAFEAADVPGGTTFLSAQRPGYFGEGAGRVGSTMSLKPTLIDDSHTTVKLKLTPGGVIHGRISNSDGEPLEGIQVQLSAQMIVNGLKSWMVRGSTSTDETGSFTFEEQMPGQYILHTLPSRLYLQPADLEINGEHLPELYPASYYPNAPDRASAQPIQVAGGGQTEADFTLNAVPGYSISGTVAGAPRAFVHCESDSGEMLSMNGINNSRSGKFTITGVPSGPCKLVARTSFGGTNNSLTGEQEVNVASADITGVQIRVTESLPDIPINVLGQSAGTLGAGANVILVPASSSSFQRTNSFVSMRPGENGVMQQVVHNPTPGVYRLSVMAHGNNCVASVVSGGTDLMKENLVIARDAPTAPIMVTLRSDCGSITGHIDGVEANTPAWVIITSGGQVPRQQYAMNGSLNVANLSPGEYQLYAFDNIADLEYANPDVMKNFESQRVSVGPSDKATVQLKLLKAPVGP